MLYDYYFVVSKHLLSFNKTVGDCWNNFFTEWMPSFSG